MVDEEVIPDVQDLQVQFGIDADGDGAAEKYVNPGSVGTASIVSARIWLLIPLERRTSRGSRTAPTISTPTRTSAAANDKRRRILMSKTIRSGTRSHDDQNEIRRLCLGQPSSRWPQHSWSAWCC
jgi:hypothetical protein